MTPPSARTIATWLAGTFLVLVSAPVAAEPAMMSRQEIIDIARSGLDNGYKWGHSRWNRDGTGHVKCSKKKKCDDCSCIKPVDYVEGGSEACEDYYPNGGMGADCSGYVAKCWQVPNAVEPEVDSHPFGTGSFRTEQTHWTQIERADLKRADALVYRTDKEGHIVLFESGATSNDDQGHSVSYNVYEAGGCNVGVRKGPKTISSAYIAIRRNNLKTTACREDTCNHHGECQPDVGCVCQLGYGGEFCDRCEVPGFVGYPSCNRADSKCQLSGTLDCKTKPITLTPSGGSHAMADYACGAHQLTGGELAFRFDERKTGKAKLVLEQSAGVGARLLLLRGACAPEGCVAASDSQLEFDYGGGEVYFVAIDTPDASTGSVTLKVQCDQQRAAWIGDPCNDAADCKYSDKGQSGTCYKTSAGGFCTLPCTKYCPDQPNQSAGTFCIADPQKASAGMCVSKADALNQRCAGIPGTASQSTMRFNDSVSEDVCYPGATPPSCSGGFTGRVVDFATSKPLANARVSVEGKVGMMLQVDGTGMYRTESMPCGSYTLHISADGYVPINARLEVDADVMTQMHALKAVSATGCAEKGALSGLVFDAISRERKPLAGAKISVRAEVGQGIGPIAIETESGADGMYSLQNIPSGTYSVGGDAQGYASAQVVLSVCGADKPQTQDLGLTATSSLPLRVVLRWNKPDDLDLHLQTPQSDEVYFYTPCRGSIDRAPFAQLDIDRRHAEGPEVITVGQFLPGRYTVFVHNYSAQTLGDPTQLPDSAAEVTVYGPNNKLLATYAVPAVGSGLSWDVFSFDGADPTQLSTLQKLTARPDPETQYSQDCRP